MMRWVSLSVCSLAMAVMFINSFGEVQKYALIVGITGYPKFPNHMQLRYADQDAKLFYDFILRSGGGGFPSENIRLLLNPEAERTQISRSIEWLSDRVTSEDIVYIFYSGHGVVDDLGIGYFMPYDADPGLPEDRGFRTDRFVENLHHKLASTRIILFTDACHAGSAFSQAFAKEGLTNVTRTINAAWREALEGQEAVSTAFMSASSNQKSYEDPRLEHGIFTWYLVEGLKGAADSNRDRIVTTGEIYRYVLDKVESHASTVLNVKQSPSRSPHFTPSFPLAILGNSGTGSTVLLNKTDEAHKHFDKGWDFLVQREYDRAITSFQMALQLAPDFADAYVNLGYIYQGRFNLQAEISSYRKAIEIDPNNAMAHNNLGFNYMRLTKFRKAITHLERAYSLSPFALAGLNLGDAYRYSGEFMKGLEWHELVSQVVENLGSGEKWYLGFRWRMNFMPVKIGDVETIMNSVEVPTEDEKKLLFITLSVSITLLIVILVQRMRNLS